MTKRERGNCYYKKSMKLFGRAFDNNDEDLNELHMEINRVWYEVEEAAKDKLIFKQDAELCYKHLREAFRYVRHHKQYGNKYKSNVR